MHTDTIRETFDVEKRFGSGGKAKIIERSYPIAPALMGIYKPGEQWSFLPGAGVEFASEGIFFREQGGCVMQC